MNFEWYRYGNNDTDLILGGSSHDLLSGDDGNDVIFGDTATVVVQRMQTTNSFVPVNAMSVPCNASGLNTLYGGEGDNIVVGGVNKGINCHYYAVNILIQ